MQAKAAGWLMAVTVAAAGCGVSVSTSGAPGISCPATQTACGKTCVDTSSDMQNCGACGNSCGVTCDSGKCVDVTSVAVGQRHTCAVLSDDSTWCWGNDERGQLGIGADAAPEMCDVPGSTPSPCSTKPVRVSGLSGVEAIDAGSDHTCALLVDGSVECWGDNQLGQSGLDKNTAPTCDTATGSVSCVHEPTKVPGVPKATAIATGDYHTCALLADGSVECWGEPFYGALGLGSVQKDGPAKVAGLSNVAAIAAGTADTCAVRVDGSVECWGDNESGQLGVDPVQGPEICPALFAGEDAMACSTSPIAVPALSGATTLGIGLDHICAVRSGGLVECTGTAELSGLPGVSALVGGYCALLSNGAVDCSTQDKSPTPVPGLSNVVTIDAAPGFGFCAIVASGSLECWNGSQLERIEWP